MNIAPGGVSGIAIMIKYLTSLPVGLVSLVINIPLLIAAYRFIGKRFAARTVRSVIIFSLLMDAVIMPYFPQYYGDRMVGSIFGGVCMGAGVGMIFLRGSSTGGTDVVSYFVERRFPYIQIGKAIMIIDLIVISISVAVFGNLESALYGVVALFCQSQVIDRIVYGNQKGRKILVISRHSHAIADRIMNVKNRGVTFLHGCGGYTGDELEVIMCVIRIWEYQPVKELIYTIDPNAFVVVSEAERIIGEGF
jgi:uncharacterized membrane-anchored protein YitT (DUF2179 family)